MNITELKEFLTNFNIEKDKLKQYLENKEITELNSNLYLLDKNYEKLKNEISNDKLIYIQLKYLSPSILLLNWIKNNTKNVLKVKSDKRALDFTYGKDLFTDLVTKHPKAEFTLGQNYIVTYDDNILGYVEMAEKILNNEFHVGDYLKEN
ncbi:MAG: hypothetical protein HRU03_07830 [Nanoarchaeales archaeon]|nr:hypothetical protein [Nanoarchaeales archaeon]